MEPKYGSSHEKATRGFKRTRKETLETKPRTPLSSPNSAKLKQMDLKKYFSPSNELPHNECTTSRSPVCKKMLFATKISVSDGDRVQRNLKLDSQTSDSCSSLSDSNVADSSTSKINNLKNSETCGNMYNVTESTSDLLNKLLKEPVLKIERIDEVQNAQRTYPATIRANTIALSLSDESDGENDLPAVVFSSRLEKSENGTDKLVITKSTKKKDYCLPQYKFGVDSILEEREKHKVENEQLEQMERELKSGNCLIVKPTILEDNGLDVQVLARLSTDKIESLHPGLKLFDLTKCFCLYRVPLVPTLPEGLPISEIDKILITHAVPDVIYRLLGRGRSEQLIKHLLSRHWMLSYLFHLMASHNNCQLIDSCFGVFDSIKRMISDISADNKASPQWRPTVEDLVAVLVNYGVDLSILLPKNHNESLTLQNIRKKFFAQSTNSNNEQEETIRQFPLRNLCLVLRTITSFVDIGVGYEDEELATLLQITCTISLANNLANFVTDRDFTDCLDAILENISENYWDSNISRLCRSLLDVTDHHHNMVNLIQLTPYSQRGFQMRKLYTFLALSNLLQADVDEEITGVVPRDVLNLCKESLHRALKDYYLLHSVVTLVDLCIKPDLYTSMSRKTLNELVTVLRDTSSRIRDNVYHLDSTKVKNVIISVMTEWNFLGQNLPSAQKTLFSYMNTNYKIQEITSHQVEGDDRTSEDDPADIEPEQ